MLLYRTPAAVQSVVITRCSAGLSDVSVRQPASYAVNCSLRSSSMSAPSVYERRLPINARHLHCAQSAPRHIDLYRMDGWRYRSASASSWSQMRRRRRRAIISGVQPVSCLFTRDRAHRHTSRRCRLLAVIGSVSETSSLIVDLFIIPHINCTFVCRWNC